MSDPANDPLTDAGEVEVRHLPVLAEAPEARPIDRVRPSFLPAPVVAATGGFLIGVATFVLVRLLRRPARGRLARRGGGRRGRGRAPEVLGSRSFLVDVHLLDKR